MKFKKVVALVLSALAISSTFSVSSYAENLSPIIDEEIVLEYETARDLSNSLTISSSIAYCDSVCTGFNNVVQISVTQTLQKFWGLWIWNDIEGAEWSDSKSSNYISLFSTKGGLSSGTYRLKSVFTLTTSNGGTETITIYSSEKSN